eukprot:EG_transcript_6982
MNLFTQRARCATRFTWCTRYCKRCTRCGSIPSVSASKQETKILKTFCCVALGHILQSDARKQENDAVYVRCRRIDPSPAGRVYSSRLRGVQQAKVKGDSLAALAEDGAHS